MLDQNRKFDIICELTDTRTVAVTGFIAGSLVPGVLFAFVALVILLTVPGGGVLRSGEHRFYTAAVLSTLLAGVTGSAAGLARRMRCRRAEDASAACRILGTNIEYTIWFLVLFAFASAWVLAHFRKRIVWSVFTAYDKLWFSQRPPEPPGGGPLSFWQLSVATLVVSVIAAGFLYYAWSAVFSQLLVKYSKAPWQERFRREEVISNKVAYWQDKDE